MSAPARSRGASVVGVLIVLVITSIALRALLPLYRQIECGSVASRAAGDLNVLRAAAVAEFEATGSYPHAADRGTCPREMRRFLPARFSFARPEYVLGWENWSLPELAAHGEVPQVLAVTVTSPDSLISRQILQVLGAASPHWTVGNTNTFVLLSTL